MEILFKAAEYVAWLKAQAAAKRPYWYGTYYLPCTDALLTTKRRQYPAHYTAARMPRYKADIAAGQICGDCVNGAVKGAAWSELGSRCTPPTVCRMFPRTACSTGARSAARRTGRFPRCRSGPAWR